jgi:hypothetical protein
MRSIISIAYRGGHRHDVTTPHEAHVADPGVAVQRALTSAFDGLVNNGGWRTDRLKYKCPNWRRWPVSGSRDCGVSSGQGYNAYPVPMAIVGPLHE